MECYEVLWSFMECGVLWGGRVLGSFVECCGVL